MPSPAQPPCEYFTSNPFNVRLYFFFYRLSAFRYLAAAPDYAKVLEPQAGDPNLTRTLVIIFDALNLFSAITLSTVLLIAWFSIRIRRVSTWYLYIFSWDVYSLGYLLILGYQAGGTMPVKGLCLFQAAMIYATPVL